MIKKLDNIRFGIEIEAEFPQSKDSYDLIQRNRIIRGWKIDEDGSLDNGAEYKPKDNNKLYFGEESLTQIKEIIALVKVHKGHIRTSCGLHIHIDAKEFTDTEIVNIVKKFIKNQSQIKKDFCVVKSRLKYNSRIIPKSVIKKINEDTIKKIRSGNEYDYSDNFYSNRNYMLNLQSLFTHGTLEFRFFNGTIMYNKIKGHIRWTINFCLNKKENND